SWPAPAASATSASSADRAAPRPPDPPAPIASLLPDGVSSGPLSPRSRTMMTTMTSVATLGLAGLLAVAAPAAVPAKMDAAAAQKGRTVFVRYCVACHGTSAKGDGPIAKDLRVRVPDLTLLKDGDTFPYQQVIDSVAKGSTVRGHGTDDMPAWGPAFNRTTGTGAATVDQAIHNLAHYIWSIQAR